MSQTKRVLRHVCVEVAKARRKCHRQPNKHTIGKGERCLVCTESSGGRRNYCSLCAGDILDLAAGDIADMRRALRPNGEAGA